MLPVVKPVVYPSALDKQRNGMVDADRLRSVTTRGGTATLINPAHRSWLALAAAAEAAGHVLVPYSTYRDRASQERLFFGRYKLKPKAGVDTKTYKGQTWYLHSGFITAAPGTSNHGWGLAIDVRVRRPNGDLSLGDDDAALAWMAANAPRFGFSWEV